MSFMSALPALEEAVGASTATSEATAGSGNLGRLANLAKGQSDGQGKQPQQKTEPNDIMADIGTEAHRYL